MRDNRGDARLLRPGRPLRRFGQNFLADRVLAERLVELFDPLPGETVVEIGPGTGALTGLLAPRCGRFVALELDERLVPGIAELLAGRPSRRSGGPTRSPSTGTRWPTSWTRRACG